MADEKQDNPNARIQSKSQGSIQPTSSSQGASGNNNGSISAAHSNALPSQSRPAANSIAPSKVRLTSHESQPMTATSSTSSAPADHGTTTMELNGPSPYGTRSRNRTGNSRPNYAEDPELEDYDWSSTKKSQVLSSAATSAHLQTGEGERSSGVNTRRSSTTALNTGPAKTTAPTTSKEQLPGMSSFSITSEASVPSHPPTKKRKAPSGGHGHSGGTATAQAQAPTQARRQVHLPGVFVGYRETNMMSFETSQAYLKNGKLRADDGTMLGVDGKQAFHSGVS